MANLQYNLDLVPSFTLGSIFTEIGHIGGIVASINTQLGTTIPGKVNTLAGDYTSNPSLIDSLFSNLTSYQSSGAGFVSYLQGLARRNIITNICVAKNLPSQTVRAGIVELIQEMRASNQSVQQCTVSLSVAPGGTNAGNPAFVLSARTRNGFLLENLFNEAIAVTCTGDAQSSNLTVGQESLSFLGQPAIANSLSPTWPGGSGCSATISAVSGLQNGSGGVGNWLTNGSFETWASGAPSNWTVAAGASVIQQSTGVLYDGTSALSIAGDGSTLPQLLQPFGTNTLTTIAPFGQYAVNLWVYLSAAAASGAIEVALVDGNGNVLLDNTGAGNVFTLALNTLAAKTWIPLNGVFRTARVLPASVSLRVRMTTAVPSGVTLYLDRAAFTAMTQLYTGGPFVAAFSGNEAMIQGDTWTITASNNYGGKFQRLFDQLFGMKSMRLLLPSSNSPTIADSLIA